MYFACKRSTCIKIIQYIFFSIDLVIKSEISNKSPCTKIIFSLSSAWAIKKIEKVEKSIFPMRSAWAKKNFRRRPDKVAHALLKEHSGSSACAK